MSQKTVWLPEIGELTLAKRRGSRNIRISVSATGRVRVGLPNWMPYSAGISFALSRKSWLLEHSAKSAIPLFSNGDRIGKSYRLRYQQELLATKTTARVLSSEVLIKTNLSLSHATVQAQAKKAGERALKKEAAKLLPARLDQLAQQNNFIYRSVKIKKMTSRWGSCTSQKDIALNFFLMQLPWQLIDYVLMHELVHTKHLNHGVAFWQNFEDVYPNAKAVRKQVNNYRPVINSVGVNMA